MKLSVTVIARNEEEHLARLLPRLGFADEVILVDTGSVDNTKTVAQRFGCKVFDFTWIDDFSAARNFALSKARGEFVMWLDADDILPQNTQNRIMGWKKSPQTADTYFIKYRVGATVWFWRERILRNCAKCKFEGFIHEAIKPFGKQVYLDCEVLHRPSASHERRNLAIYRKQMENGRRFSLRDNYYFARTLAENGLADEAFPVLRKFASQKRADIADRVGAYKLLAGMALNKGLLDDARKYLAKASLLLPPDSEACCLWGKSYFDEANYAFAAEWYCLALCATGAHGFSDSYYREFLPNVQLSVCMWRLGDFRSARRYHLAARSVCPHDPVVLRNDEFFIK